MMNETSKAFGAHLKQLRNAAGMTQMQLADAATHNGARLTHVMVAKIETNIRPTTVTELLALAQALNVTPAALLPDSSETARSEVEVMAVAMRCAAVTAIDDAIATLEDARRRLPQTD